MRDAFAVLFFVSVGMLLDPAFVMNAPLLILSALAVVLVGKPLVALALVLAVGLSRRASRFGSPSRSRRSASSRSSSRPWARSSGCVTDDVRNTLIATAIVSIAVNPLLYRAVAPLERWIPQRRTARDARRGGRRTERPVDRDPRHRAVVIGYGPVGQDRRAAAAPERRHARPSSISTSRRCERCATKACPAIYGDAGHRDTLVSAGVPTAGAIILSVAGLPDGPRGDPHVARAEPVHPHPGADGVHPRARDAQAGRRQRRLLRAKARSRWRSRRRFSAGWARHLSRSIASARACTRRSCRR